MHLSQMRLHCGRCCSHSPDPQYSLRFPSLYHHQDQWVGLVGLEGGSGRFLPLWFRAGPMPLMPMWVCPLCPVQSCINSLNLDLLGVDMGLLVAVDHAKHATGTAVTAFSPWGWQWIQQIGAQLGSANKGDIQQGRHWRRWSPIVMWWTVWGVQDLWDFHGLSTLVVIGMSSSDHCSAAQHFIHIVNGELQRRCTRASPWLSQLSLIWEKTSWKVESASSAIWAHCFSCFLVNLVCHDLCTS